MLPIVADASASLIMRAMHHMSTNPPSILPCIIGDWKLIYNTYTYPDTGS